MARYPYEKPGTQLDEFRENLIKTQEDVAADINDVAGSLSAVRIETDEKIKGVRQQVIDIAEEAATIAYSEVVDAARLEWLEPVATASALPSAYPAAPVGSAVMARDTGEVHRFNGVEWRVIQQIDAGPVNALATATALQLADIVTNVKAVDGEDATAKIQSALNKKGHVRLYGTGTVFTGRLLIDDDTVFEVMPGFTLKKKTGTDHYILVNRGHVEGYRNKNITVKGGHWHMNAVGNPNAGGDLSTNIQAWSGMGIMFNKVDNLIIEDIEEIGEEHKYCFLIADITQGIFRRINMVNESDGLHLQPPLNNITIEDISGVTNDDLISFTMGDYPRYSLGQYGNVENVICRNIHGREGTAELVKMVGSGMDGKSVFKNMKFENISGYASAFPVFIMKEDQAIANPCLKDTKLENVVFENVNAVQTAGSATFSIGAASGDITIKKLKINHDQSDRHIILNKCNLDKVHIDDVHVIPGAGTMTRTTSVVNIANDTEVVKQLIISNSNIELNNVAGAHLVFSNNGSVKTVHIDKSIIKMNNGTILSMGGVTANTTNVFVDNSDITANILANVSIPLNVSVSNSKISTILRTFQMNDGANVRLLTNNTDLSLVINGTTANRLLSVNGDLKSNSMSSVFTPRIGDSYIYDNPNDQKNKGRYTFNGVIWSRNFTLTSFNTDVIVGTLNAHSTKEMQISSVGIGNNKSVMANPTFVLPIGVVFSVIHRQTDLIRLRLANVTAAPIVFNDTTEKEWNIKVINDAYVI